MGVLTKEGLMNEPCWNKIGPTSGAHNRSCCCIHRKRLRCPSCAHAGSKGKKRVSDAVTGGPGIRVRVRRQIILAFLTISGPFRCLFWDDFGTILGPFWDHFGPFWDHVGTILGFWNSRKGTPKFGTPEIYSYLLPSTSGSIATLVLPGVAPWVVMSQLSRGLCSAYNTALQF